MKEKDINLTLRETEELCRLYIGCRLSVLEERELEYMLSHLPYSTPEINATRAMMGLPVPSAISGHKRRWPRSAPWVAAASVIVLMAVALGIIFTLPEKGTEYEAFANGRTLNPDEARIQAIEQSKNADDIIDIMDVMILERQLQYENFKKNLALYP